MKTDRRKILAAEVRRFVFSQNVVDNTPVKIAEEAIKLGRQVSCAAYKNYVKALAVLRELEPAWNALSDTQQFILREFYGQASKNTGATLRVADALSISKRQVFRLCGSALDTFDAALTAARATHDSTKMQHITTNTHNC